MDDVKRYAVYDRHLSQGGGHEIEEDTDGDFVRHSDYAALQARLADLETKLGEVEAQLATARRDALEEAAQAVYDEWMSGTPVAEMHDRIRALIAQEQEHKDKTND